MLIRELLMLKEASDVDEAQLYQMGDLPVGTTVIYKVIRGGHKISKVKSKREPSTLLLQSGDTIEAKAVVSTDKSDWADGKYEPAKRVVKEADLNEFAQSPKGDGDEPFNDGLAKMAKNEGISKGVSLNDFATLARAFEITSWDTAFGGLYKQYFADGWKIGRKDKVSHDNRQYGLKLKVMPDGSIEHDAKNESIVQEGDTPSWFKSGAKVKLRRDYADKNPNEVFTLQHEGGSRGTKRWLADKSGSGWYVFASQVYPAKYKTEPEDLDEGQEDNQTFTPKDDGKEGKYGVKVGQVYVPADGSKNKLKVLSINHAAEDALVYDEAQGKERHIDLFKLAKVRYSLKEDAELQSLGKQIAGKVAEPEEAEAVDTSAPNPIDTPAKTAAPVKPKYEAGQVVIPNIGPHKGLKHEVIGYEETGPQAGWIKIKPIGLKPEDIQYKGSEKGAVVNSKNLTLAQKNDVPVASVPKPNQPVSKTTESLMSFVAEATKVKKPMTLQQMKDRRIEIIDKMDRIVQAGGRIMLNDPLNKELMQLKHDIAAAKKLDEGRDQTFMPLSYRPGRGHKIEAYGRKGMKNTMWRKFFKDSAALEKWCEDNDATVEGSRDLDKSEMR